MTELRPRSSFARSFKTVSDKLSSTFNHVGCSLGPPSSPRGRCEALPPKESFRRDDDSDVKLALDTRRTKELTLSREGELWVEV
jgi:hypothetical protein